MLEIYVVDDEPMAIEYLKVLMSSVEGDHKIIGSSTGSMQAFEDIRRLKPDVIFADIVMPVMNGVELAERVMEIYSPKFYLLTSYRDFEYAKKSVQIGVTDYILKNELSEELIRKTLEKAEEMLNEERRNRQLILEHNIRDFLNSGSIGSEDMSYNDRPLQKYSLIRFIAEPKIILHHKTNSAVYNIDCYEAEHLVWPKGITCNCFLKTGDNEYTAIFFINDVPAEAGRVLYKAADMLLDLLDSKGGNWIGLVGDIKQKFFDLPGSYREMGDMQAYLYNYSDQRIVYLADMRDIKRTDVDTAGYIHEIELSLNEKSRRAVELTEELFGEASKNLNIWEYNEMIRDLYRMLEQFDKAKQLSVNSLIISDSYNNTKNAERALLNCVEMLLQELEQAHEQMYSEHIRKALAYIEENYDRDISVEMIASDIGVSEGHLRRLFNQELGSNIVGYLKNLRLDKAIMLMKEKGEPVSTVWQKTGFTSAQYFSYVFKQREGMLPREYVKRGLLL
ncbi:MAG: helix-turn-helix domain-containing protein [Lachnospiraceae bacterium]|nr:helix-turn-helix domain-containing protein [Lachnospiraceae bacterium]